MPGGKLIIQQVSEERTQGHATRQQLYLSLRKQLNLPVVSFFTSFRYPVAIEDSDADMLEGVLRESDVSKGFVLLLSSPGGFALAAERIINVCRSYSNGKGYAVAVCGKAKSAATMICLGATNIMMSPTAELGSVDPQITYTEDGKAKRFSVYNIVQSYEKLFAEAVKTEGRVEPYLQQLANYDAREIAEFKGALALSQDITVKALQTGMLKGRRKKQILTKMRPFLTPETAKAHGRPIYGHEAKRRGLKIDILELREKPWGTLYELHTRLNDYVSRSRVAKCVESEDFSFVAQVESES